VHLFPFRTEPLSPGAPMVLPSPVGESVAANFISVMLLSAFISRQEHFVLPSFLLLCTFNSLH
uniref:hypothetical protein n=1 Tax=Hymenobacter caeli TaxID=2735894 RepID=UPI001C2CF656